jgi:NTP pyrophosphatase (non-canonical NTP hydrolase)
MTREQVIGVMGQALDDALDNGALTRLAQLNCIYDALAAAGMIVGGGEAVAWLHKVTEPDGSSHDLFSDSPNNPWSHWVEAHREQCIYAATPLYTHPTPSAQGYVLDWSWIRSVLAQGADIQKDYIAGNHETYEHYSARLDVAARERLDQLTASPPAPASTEPLTADAIYQQIKHGDEQHRAWLKESLDNVFAGKPVLPMQLPAAPEMVMRPEVRAFANLMERELRNNDHKGGWKNDSAEDLMKRVLEEALELSEEVKINFGRTPEQRAYDIGEEAADVANMAMMVADVCGALGAAASADRRRRVMGTMDKLFDGSAAHELCSACGGTGRVYEGEICRFCEQDAELARLRAELEHWKANHATEVMKNAVLRQRPDLPVDRLPVMRELEKLRADAGFAGISRDPDGEPALDLILDARNMLSISVSPAGNISWAGTVAEQRDHGVIRDDKLGKMLFAILDAIEALRAEGDERE